MNTATPTDIGCDADPRGLIVEIFEETALMLGGLIAVHRVDDDFVWRFVKGLDAVRCKAMRRVTNEQDAAQQSEEPESRLRPHPAIEDFLHKVRRP